MQLSDEAKKGLDDLFYFSCFFVGLTLEEQPHREMCQFIQDAETDTSRPYSMLTVPRGTYKSSIAVTSSVTWKLLRQLYLYDNPYHRIVIASATLALGKSALQMIEGIWRSGGKYQRINDHYQPLWMNKTRDLPSSKKEDGLVFAPRILAGEIAELKEPNVFIGSMRRISTGFHADEAVIDDLNNLENTKTDHQLKQTHDYFHLLFPILGTTDRGGNPTKITMLATPWHDYDVRGMITREEKQKQDQNPNYVSKWRILHRGCVNEDGTPFFPSKYPLERLEELRALMGPRQFSANYECDPVGRNGMVNEEDIKFKDRDAFPPLVHGRICVDPNQHKEATELGCYAAIIVAGYDKFGRMYVVDARGSREWGTEQFLEELFELKEQYPNWIIYMEEPHMGHFDAALRMEEVRRTLATGRDVRCRVCYVPTGVNTSKYERWQRVLPRFKSGTIYFSDSIAPALKTEIKEELVRGTASRFKDFLDALALAETGLRPKIQKDGSMQELKQQQPQQPNSPSAMTFASVWGDKWRNLM